MRPARAASIVSQWNDTTLSAGFRLYRSGRADLWRCTFDAITYSAPHIRAAPADQLRRWLGSRCTHRYGFVAFFQNTFSAAVGLLVET
jgi:hypothetical protein